MDVSQVPFFSIAMENLLAAHENDPVCYALEESHDSAFILHTSGTTGGSGENADDPITKTLEFLKRKDMKPWDIFNPFMHYKLLMPDDPEEKLKMPEIPQNVRKAGLKYVNRIAGIPYGRKSIDVDFEED